MTGTRAPFAAVAAALALLCSGTLVRADETQICSGVRCGGRGTCMVEREEPFCLCQDGYAAVELSCVPVPRRPRSTSARPAAVRARIVEIATAEVGKGPRAVGRGLARYPFGLGRYLAPAEPWCTDFVSWVYMLAGLPLTGGAEGGWMIGNNIALRTWFARHDAWVGKGGTEWSEFEPQPGDFLRLDTQRGGHGGIVTRVEGDVVHTVEGNVGNRVRERHHDGFRAHRRVDGFGSLARL